MKLIKYKSNVSYTDYDERTDRAVMGFVKGDNYSLAIDAGNSPKTAREFLNLINQQPDYVVLTHYHWDHTFGLSEFSGISISSKRTAKAIDTIYNKVWNEESFNHYCIDGSIEPFCAEHMREEYGSDFSSIHVKLPDITFKNTLNIELGNCKVTLMKIQNPHTNDGIIVYVPDRKIIFLGDALCEELRGDQWIDHPNKTQFMYSSLKPLDFKLAVNAHFDPMTKEELLNNLKDRLQD